MHPKSEQIEAQLEVLAQRIPTTYFMAVVDVDGLLQGSYPINEKTPYYNEEDRISAMSAALNSLGERMVNELGGGQFGLGILQGDKITIFEVVLGDEFVLIFGVREIRTIDATLVILQQWWDELLVILEVDAPEL